MPSYHVMHSILRIYGGVFLAALLAFTSVQVAAARGHAPAVGTAVLCIGQTVVTVQVDADGQPVEQQHLCPDIALFVDAGAGFVPLAPQIPITAQTYRADALRFVSRDAPQRRARGPPVQV